MAAAGFSTGKIVGELDAVGFVKQSCPECELPKISQSVLPHIESFGVYGTVLAALIITTTIIGFRLLRSEEARYRLVTIIHTVAWPIVILGVMLFFLAAYALPYAKCTA